MSAVITPAATTAPVVHLPTLAEIEAAAEVVYRAFRLSDQLVLRRVVGLGGSWIRQARDGDGSIGK